MSGAGMAGEAPRAEVLGRIHGLHVEAHGPAEAPPLLMVHGFLSSRAQWRPNLAALAGPFRPVLVELLGHARSEAPEDPARYAPEAYHAAFEAIREALGAARWAVCGQSFGAGLSLGYAARHPERVTAQVFTNTGASFRDFSDPAQAEETRRRAAEIRAGGAAAVRAQRVHPANARRFPEAVKRELVADAEGHAPHGVAANLETTLPRLNQRQALRRNRIPSLLVNGRFERRFQPHADWAARTVPRLRRVDLDGGHSVNVEQAAGFDAAVLDFLAAQAAASA